MLSIILTLGHKMRSYNKCWLKWEKLNVIDYPAGKTASKRVLKHSPY